MKTSSLIIISIIIGIVLAIYLKPHVMTYLIEERILTEDDTYYYFPSDSEVCKAPFDEDFPQKFTSIDREAYGRYCMQLKN